MKVYWFIIFFSTQLLSFSQIGVDTTVLSTSKQSLNLLSDTSILKQNLKSTLSDFASDNKINAKSDSFSLKKKLNLPLKDSTLNKEKIKQKLSQTKSNVLNKKDTLSSVATSKVKDLKSNSLVFLKKQWKAFQPHGSISVGYEYGVLPFVSGDNYPSGGFKSEGRVSFLALNVPLTLNYYYTNIKNVIGLNNYFTINYDADRYKEQLSQKLGAKEQLIKTQLDRLPLLQQQMAQKLEYLSFLQKFPDYKYPQADSLSLNTNALTPKIDSSKWSVPTTTNINLPKLDTSVVSQYTNKTKDSLSNQSNYVRKKDSIANEVAIYKAKYDSITEEVNTLKKRYAELQNLQNNPTALANPYLSKVQNFLSHIKKFEIGLCHPNYSTFLANNIPLQGINVEYSKNNRFVAFTYGTTINNLMYNNNTIQGTIQGTRNLYNYFNFGNLSAGRKIISLKGGVGTKEGSHLYVGCLLAKGKSNYLQLNSIDGINNSSTIESNVVLELDAKYKVSDQLSVDVVIGKSSVKEEDLSMEQIKRSVNEIFSNYRSYAMLGKINYSIKKTKTRLMFSTRWVDPFFKSFGIGFMRSDNLRYEFKIEQPITSKIKYTLSYRREEDNLLRLYNYKNTIQSINNVLNIKFNRQFNVRLIYAPLFRNLQSAEITKQDKNYISTAIATYTPKFKKVDVQFNGLYSRYLVTGDSTDINFENVTYTHQLTLKSGFKTGMNVSWFRNSLKDTLGNDTYLGVLDVGYVAQNANSITLGYKMAYKKGLEPQYGFVLRAKLKVYKNLFWDAEIEKILIGDYYNGFAISKIQEFPYYCNTRLTFNF